MNRWTSVLSLTGAALLAAPVALGQSTTSGPPAQPPAEPAAAATTSTPPAAAPTDPVADNARINAAAADPDRLPPHDPNRLLNRDVGATYSLGWRFWYHAVPAFIPRLFAFVAEGWSGGGGVVTGPEFVYRNGSVDIVLGLQYAGYFADYGHFRGLNEPVVATEQVKADLWSIQFTSHFLYGIRAHRMFEVQIGAGIGAGGMGGTLNRYQAYETAPGQFAACARTGGTSMAPGMLSESASEPCNNRVNNHFADRVDAQGRGTGGYAENNWVTSGGGYVPLIIPWLSLPHIAMHVRPHRNFDLRFEGGFSLIGFYGGATAHYVF